MSPLRAIWLVARRELRERSRGRTYRITTLILMIVVVAAIVLPAVIDPDDGVTYELGIVGDLSPDFVPILELLAGASGASVADQLFESVSSGEAAVTAGEIDALLVDGVEIVVQQSAPSDLFITGGSGLIGLLNGVAQGRRRKNRQRSEASSRRIRIDSPIKP